jgi:hypothetical protein
VIKGLARLADSGSELLNLYNQLNIKLNMKLNTAHSSDNDHEEHPTRALKSPCNICMKDEHKYKCPRCDLLTCSLVCSKEHKQKFNCSGLRDHVSSLRVKMQDFTLGTMRKDLRFIDEAIAVSNKSKKDLGVVSIPTVSKKVKNLRYFLKKKRNIIYKHSPSAMFSRS